jgi:hypothetical protein
LDKYQIDTKKKQISIRGIGGKGEIGEVVIFTPDTGIRYDTTTLVILGQQILFREYLPPECDPDSISVLSSNERATIFACKNNLYVYSDRHTSQKTDISGYKIIDNFFFLNKQGELFYFNNRLEKITGLPSLDIKTLKFATGHYFTDKNGLYFLGWHYDYKNQVPVTQSVKVDSSFGKTIEPIITRNVIIYNNSVYSLSEEIYKLDIDVATMHQLGEQEGYRDIIYDDKIRYEKQYYPYSAIDKTVNNLGVDFFSKRNIKLENVLPGYLNFITRDDSSVLYLPLGERKYIRGSEVYKKGTVVKTSDGYYFLKPGMPASEPQRIKQVLVFNVDKKRYQKFDFSQFKSITNNVFVYKDHVFFDYLPLKYSLDTKQLSCLTKNGIKANYITDGKTMINLGSLIGYSSVKVSDIDRVIFPHRVVTGFDESKIQVVNKDVLIDDHYIYNFGERIPIDQLRMKLKICPQVR